MDRDGWKLLEQTIRVEVEQGNITVEADEDKTVLWNQVHKDTPIILQAPKDGATPPAPCLLRIT